MKKIHVLLALLMVICLSCGNTAFAADINTSDSSASSDVVLNHEATTFSVTVPTGLPIDAMADGTIITASDCVITNNSYAPVVVSDVSVEATNGWSLVDFESKFTGFAVNKKNLGLCLNSENVSESGDIALNRLNWPIINGYRNISLNYNAKLPAVSQATEYHSIANVIFTISFWEAESSQPNPDTNAANPAVKIHGAKGDLDLSDDIGISDYMLLNSYLEGSVELNAEQIYAADVNSDGTIDTDDATLLYDMIIGLA